MAGLKKHNFLCLWKIAIPSCVTKITKYKNTLNNPHSPKTKANIKE